MAHSADGIEVPCVLTPNLSLLPADIRDRVQFDGDLGVLRFSGHLGGTQARVLRDCHPGDASWQVVVDQVVTGLEVSRRSRASQFPSTLWGQLLVDLGTESDQHWRAFLDDYRVPIRRSIDRLVRDRRGAQAEDLADGFFGWFFDKAIHRKISRVSADGKVFRFRGYLSRCLRTYLREELGARSHGPLHDDAAEVMDSVESTMDREFCCDAIDRELMVLRRDQFSLWRALVSELEGRTLDDVVTLLRFEGEQSSITAAHRARHEARRALRSRLVQYRLRNGTVTTEDALDEYRELIPNLAEALRSYVTGIRGEPAR